MDKERWRLIEKGTIKRPQDNGDIPKDIQAIISELEGMVDCPDCGETDMEVAAWTYGGEYFKLECKHVHHWECMDCGSSHDDYEEACRGEEFVHPNGNSVDRKVFYDEAFKQGDFLDKQMNLFQEGA